MKMPREVTACALWVAASALMMFGSLDTERAGHNSPFLAWGVFCAIIAVVPTVMSLLDRTRSRHEEETVEHIIEVVDALHAGRSEVTRLR